MIFLISVYKSSKQVIQIAEAIADNYDEKFVKKLLTDSKLRYKTRNS